MFAFLWLLYVGLFCSFAIGFDYIASFLHFFLIGYYFDCLLGWGLLFTGVCFTMCCFAGFGFSDCVLLCLRCLLWVYV